MNEENLEDKVREAAKAGKGRKKPYKLFDEVK